MPGSFKCRLESCTRYFYTEQGEAAHYGKAHPDQRPDADILLLATLNSDFIRISGEIKLAEERAETYQELADISRESVRSRRLEATILQDKIREIRLKYADLGIPLEVHS